MSKYASQQLLGQSPQVVWPGFAIPTQSSHGAAKLAEELNSLETRIANQAKILRASKRDIQALLNAVLQSQRILAEYIEPGPKLNPRQRISCLMQVVNDLLEVLDQRHSNRWRLPRLLRRQAVLGDAGLSQGVCGQTSK